MKKNVRDRVLSCITPLITIFIITSSSLGIAPAELPKKTQVTPPLQKPLVIYYSRTGTTRTIAGELAKRLPAEIEEIISRKERHSIWTITCVFDQLFNWDDDIEPIRRDVDNYNPLIIASPVWIHNISSPIRTFLKYSTVKGKDAFLVLTNNGNFNEEDEKNIREKITSYGLSIQGCYPICTSDKDEDTLRHDAHTIMENIIFTLNN